MWPSSRSLIALGWTVALVTSAGCFGAIGDPGVSGDGPSENNVITRPPPPGGCVGEECRAVEEVPSAFTRVPRLTHAQWENTVHDLFRMDDATELSAGAAEAFAGFDADPPLGDFDRDARRLKVTAGLWRDYQRAAEELAAQMTASSAVLDRWLPAGLPDSGAERRRAFIEQFGRRAFRRPLSDAQIVRFEALYDEGPTHFAGVDAFTAGARIVLEAMLQAPDFVYRVERSGAASGGLIPLDDHEIASRLSYFIWNTMPDDALFAAADAGELRTADGVREHAANMFAEQAAVATMEDFHRQLYHMDRWLDLDKNIPEWRPELAPMMRQEAMLFLNDVVFSGGTIGDFLTSPKAFVNEDLAALYGVSGVTGDEYREVTLDTAMRAGFLTRLGFLTKNATLTEPDPIHRGVDINLDVLCRTITAPPNIPDDLTPVGDTNRERINSITGPGTCGASCHGGIINPLGFALETFDAIGRYRTDDGGQPVDAAATYYFEDGREISFDGPVDLSTQLATHPDAYACYATRLLQYGYGREYSDNDSPLIFRAADGSLRDGMTVQDVLIELVTSRAFRTRATTEPTEEEASE
jgi:hypothetical protein